ncbi:MAG: VOC family protein [Candidatus Latescibacteria bacterium]|nr:VOC family protein [Candidatus Latescibacterota bacterium]
MYIGIEHVAIAAKDTEGLCSWYQTVLGFRVVYDNKKSPPTYFVRLGNQTLSLIEILPAGEGAPVRKETSDPGINHIAITVDEFETAVEDLESKGVVMENIREASGGVKVGFFHDPEGNLLQIIDRPNPL